MAHICIYKLFLQSPFPIQQILFCPLSVAGSTLPPLLSSCPHFLEPSRKKSKPLSLFQFHHVLGQDGNLFPTDHSRTKPTALVVGAWGKGKGAGIRIGREYFNYLIMSANASLGIQITGAEAFAI